MRSIIFTIILPVIYTLVEPGYAQKIKCGLGRFQCKNGQCIPSESLCDGRADCKDKSDETFVECTKPEITCAIYAFRCSYGACIDGDATCNGVKDCIDNSDETLDRCTGSTYNMSTSCAQNQYKCNNGQCITEIGLCDGIADCADGSDETFIQCGSLTCSQFFFRCYYGACIDGDLKCNGVTNCVDGSDEDPRLCSNITQTVTTYRPITTLRPATSRPTTSRTTTSTRAPLPVTPKCLVPPQPKNGYWKLHKTQCCNGQLDTQTCDHCDIPQGTRLERGQYLIYFCNPGYKLKDNAIVFCNLEGKWSKIPVCTEIRCKGLMSASTNAKCTYYGESVPCESPVLPRTIASIECRTSYREDTTFLSRSQVKCNDNGEWEPEPLRCVAVCGVPVLDAVPAIVNGTLPKISEFPWHATLYIAETPNAMKEFICGASIIRDRLLLTAAHCVYNERTKRADDPSKYYIMTGNIYRDYDSLVHNSRIVKKAKVKNIYIHCDYYGLEGNHAADIAVLEITQPFVFTPTLVPICLDASNDPFVLEVGSFGKVAGFGRTAHGPSSAILQTLTVPYVSLNVCKSSNTTLQTVKYATIDKFCAGYTNGSSVCNGDSGGGLVFKLDELWYLKGIVSVALGTKQVGTSTICDNYSYSLYTRVSNYMPWIEDIIFKVESGIPMSTCAVIPHASRFN